MQYQYSRLGWAGEASCEAAASMRKKGFLCVSSEISGTHGLFGVVTDDAMKRTGLIHALVGKIIFLASIETFLTLVLKIFETTLES